MKKRIFWCGDSTVAHNYINTYPQTGMGQVIDLYLDAYIYNFAKNGRSTKSFINEGILKNVESEIKENDFVFIQFGHNDQKDDPERKTEPFSTYKDYLKQYVKSATDKGAYPVLITPLYRRLFSEDFVLNKNAHFDYPKAMIELGNELNIPVIDLCQKSYELINKNGYEKSKNWYMNIDKDVYENYKDGLEDNTHLTYNGAVVMAGLVADGLCELGGIYSDLLYRW